MYLNRLSDEERGKFLELAGKLASCDGGLRESENELVRSYMKEFSIDQIPETDSLDALAEYFRNRDSSVRRIVLFEVCALILADNDVGEEEQSAFDDIKRILGLDEKETEEIISVANDLKIIHDRIGEIVLGE